jgi:hypothetical protein
LVHKSFTLQEALELDNEGKSLYSFSNTVFKCNGFYSSVQVFRKEQPNLMGYIILALILSCLLTVTLNSYWPILWKIYSSLKKLISTQKKEEKLNVIILASQSVKVDNNDKNNQESAEDNLSNQIVEKLNDHSKKLKSRDKGLCCWIIFSLLVTVVISIFLSMVLITLFVDQMSLKEEPQCRLLHAANNQSAAFRRLSNNGSKVDLVKIISQTENSTSLLAPCNSLLFDELNNTYRIVGPYVLDCSDPIQFNYTDHIQLWENHRCCYKPGIPGQWGRKDSIELIVDGSDIFAEAISGDKCLCKQRCIARYKCIRHTEYLEKCFWKEIPLQIWVIEQEVTIIDTHITQGVFTQAPYGFWRNDTAVFLNTADNNFLEGTNYNYSCLPTSARPPCYDKYQMPISRTLNPLPELISCSILIKIPFVISDGGLP